MAARLCLLVLSAALLPGLGLAGVGGLRVCLSAMIGGAACCAPASGGPSCCSDLPAPAPDQAPEDCPWCCVELEQGAPFSETAPRAPMQHTLAPAVAQAPWTAPRPDGASPRWMRPPRAPPGARTNPPLRI